MFTDNKYKKCRPTLASLKMENEIWKRQDMSMHNCNIMTLYYDCVVYRNVTDSALIAILKPLYIDCTYMYFLINTMIDDIKLYKF